MVSVVISPDFSFLNDHLRLCLKQFFVSSKTAAFLANP